MVVVVVGTGCLIVTETESEDPVQTLGRERVYRVESSFGPEGYVRGKALRGSLKDTCRIRW